MKCNRCKENKLEFEFPKKPNGKPTRICKNCISKYGREYRRQNKHLINERKKQHAEKNKSKIAAYQKAYREKNKEKAKEYHKQYLKKNPQKRTEEQKVRLKPYLREFHLKKKYGITEADYERMLSDQGGGCVICGTKDPRGRNHNRFHVDHCHITGIVRGLLCSRCNVGLGSFQDDVTLLNKAISYLARQAKNVG